MNNLNLAKEVREQKLREGQEIGKLVLLAEARLGELFNQLPKATKGTGANQYQDKSAEIPPAGKFSEPESEDESEDEEEPPQKPKLVVAAEMGFNKNQVAQFQKLADNPNAVQQAIDYAEKIILSPLVPLHYKKPNKFNARSKFSNRLKILRMFTYTFHCVKL